MSSYRPRRVGRYANPRPDDYVARPRERRFRRGHLRADHDGHREAQRHLHRDGAHWVRQDDDALFGPPPHQHDRHEAPHRRGAGRIQRRRHRAGSDRRSRRQHVRQGAPRVPPTGPRRHDDRRDPRPRDGGDRGPGGAYGPLRVLDASHQRRSRRGHAPHRHERRAVPARLHARGGARPASREDVLPRMPRGLRARRRDAGAHRDDARPDRRASVLLRPRLQDVQRHGLQGPKGRLRIPQDVAAAPRARQQQGPDADYPRKGP